jgi:hypothetical protein
MSDLPYRSAAAWRQLEVEWASAREKWHDTTTEVFNRHYLEPLAADIEEYLRNLESLMETLRRAREVANAR